MIVLGFAGYDTVSDHVEPLAFLDLVQECLGLIGRAIGAHRGRITLQLGPYVHAVFLERDEFRTPADLSCLAVLRVEADLAAWRQSRRQRRLPYMETHIGVDTGPVRVRQPSGGRPGQPAVIGEAVEFADRIMRHCPELGTSNLVSARTIDRLVVPIRRMRMGGIFLSEDETAPDPGGGIALYQIAQ